MILVARHLPSRHAMYGVIDDEASLLCHKKTGHRMITAGLNKRNDMMLSTIMATKDKIRGGNCQSEVASNFAALSASMRR